MRGINKVETAVEEEVNKFVRLAETDACHRGQCSGAINRHREKACPEEQAKTPE